MENVRIAILDHADQVLTYMDNTAPEALHYYDDELHEYLQGSAYTFAFATSAKHDDGQYIVEGNKLAFKWAGKDYYLNLVHVEKDEQEIRAECYGLLFELLNEEKEAYKASKAMTFAEYWSAFDPEGSTVLGLNEVSDKTITHEWTGTQTLLARIYSLATVFSAEIEFVTELADNYSLKRVVANVYREHSDTYQGIGRERTDITLRYGKEISGITKTSDITDLYTAIRPTGKDGLQITSLVKTEYDENGNIEFNSPSGDNCIRAVQARNRFPSNLTKKEDGYILRVWSYDTDNAEMLYGQALAELKKICEPQVSYDVDGYFDTAIGDTVNIVDEEYTPVLYLNARVSEQIRSFTDPTRNKTTFSNFRELQSQIDQNLLDRVQEMVDANRTYTCSIITDNGIVFKNGAGTTTLSASIRDANKDVSNTLSITWYKDDEEYGVGKSLTINASDIQTKAVYRFEAVDSNGKFRGECEVTLSNVNDGAAGLQGPPGKDAKQSYTHIAYANSEDGHTDFSVDDSNREYIGMFVDYVQMDSTDPDDYRWSRIRGFDGEEGVPGKPGADGKTPYLHIAYANSADGSSGFSVTDSANKLYIGQYTDYTAADSTDPDDYAWTKIKGDKGDPGAAGVGIKSITEYYAVSSSNTTAPTSWNTSVPTMTTTNKYLWNYERITYTNNTTSDSAKRVIGVYGNTGATGAKGDKGDPGDTGATGPKGETGATGNGIKSITNYYLASASSSGVTTSTSGWTTTMQSTSTSKRYLWNYEKIAYTNGTTTNTTPVIIGTHGATGATGATGESYWVTKAVGVDLSSSTYDVDKYYPVIGTTLPNSGFARIKVSVQLNSGTKPSWSTHNNGFSVDFDIETQRSGWETTHAETIIYADTFKFCSVSPVSYTQLTYGSLPVLYLRGGGKYFVSTTYSCTWSIKTSDYTWTSGSYSQTAKVLTSRPTPVGTNIKGVGIKSVTEYYAVSTSNSTAPSSWSTSVPTMTATNKYLWNYERITYTNNTTSDSAKRVIGVYGNTGATGAKGDKGDTGATGNGISSITNYYLATTASSGVTTSTSGWTTSIQTITTSKKYLWNYEVLKYTNGNSTTTAPHIIGVYGNTGATGAKGDKGDTGAAGKDGQMLYATCGTGSATVAKVATLVSGTLNLQAGVTVAVRFTYANTAASPTLNVGGTGAKAIYTQGVRYAYWSAGATVMFTYDGSYWRVCSEPVYASTATIGNPGGYHVYIDGDSLDIMQGSKKVASFSGNGVMITGNSGDQTFAFDGKSLSVYPNNDFGTLGQVSFTVDGNGIISFERQPKVQNYPIPYFKDYEIALSNESVLIASNARADLKVNFDQSHSSAPDVVLATPYTSTGGGVHVAVKNFTKTGFTANMKNDGSTNAYFKVCYMAIWL